MDIHRASIKVDDCSNEMIGYHIKLLHQAGLIEGIDASSFEGFQLIDINLTWDGHEFLDEIRKESIWNQAKQIAIDRVGGTSLEILKYVLAAIMKNKLGYS
jgi:hypothetical protein